MEWFMKKSGIRRFLSVFLFILLFGAVHGAPGYTQTTKRYGYTKDKSGLYNWPGTFILDSAVVLSTPEFDRLEKFLLNLNDTTGIQIAVLTLRTTNGEPIHDLAVRHFEKWKLGQKGVDNGALLTVSVNDRTLDITTGDGAEGILTDILCKEIIDQVMVPEFREGRMGKGIENAVYNMAGILKSDESLVTVSGTGSAASGAAGSDRNSGTAESEDDESILDFIKENWIILLLAIIFLLINSRGSGYRGSYGGSSGGSHHSSGGHSGGSYRSGGGGRTSGGGASGKW